MSPLAMTTARRLKEKLDQALPGRLRDLRIFGSRARGSADESSDLDLLVLLDTEESPVHRTVVRLAQEVEAEMRYAFPLSPCIMSEARYRELLTRELLFALEVERDGVPV